MKPEIFIGIDPGLSGGIAVLHLNIHVPTAISMALSGKELDINYMKFWLEDKTNRESSVCYIEAVHAMPHQGVSSSFKFGLVTGEIRGMIKAMGIPLYSVAPQTWKKVVLKDTDKSKEAAIAFCRNAYPNISLLATYRSRVPHTGIADAICLAHYGMLQHQ